MVLISYPGVTARSEGDFDAQPEIGGVESGFSDHVQVRFLIHAFLESSGYVYTCLVGNAENK